MYQTQRKRAQITACLTPIADKHSKNLKLDWLTGSRKSGRAVSRCCECEDLDAQPLRARLS